MDLPLSLTQLLILSVMSLDVSVGLAYFSHTAIDIKVICLCQWWTCLFLLVLLSYWYCYLMSVMDLLLSLTMLLILLLDVSDGLASFSRTATDIVTWCQWWPCLFLSHSYGSCYLMSVMDLPLSLTQLLILFLGVTQLTGQCVVYGMPVSWWTLSSRLPMAVYQPAWPVYK